MQQDDATRLGRRPDVAQPQRARSRSHARAMCASSPSAFAAPDGYASTRRSDDGRRWTRQIQTARGPTRHQRRCVQAQLWKDWFVSTSRRSIRAGMAARGPPA